MSAICETPEAARRPGRNNRYKSAICAELDPAAALMAIRRSAAGIGIAAEQAARHGYDPDRAALNAARRHWETVSGIYRALAPDDARQLYQRLRETTPTPRQTVLARLRRLRSEYRTYREWLQHQRRPRETPESLAQVYRNARARLLARRLARPHADTATY